MTENDVVKSLNQATYTLMENVVQEMYDTVTNQYDMTDVQFVMFNTSLPGNPEWLFSGLVMDSSPQGDSGDWFLQLSFGSEILDGGVTRMSDSVGDLDFKAGPLMGATDAARFYQALNELYQYFVDGNLPDNTSTIDKTA